MANSYYLPAGQNAFYTWSLNFLSKITATPTAYGLVAGDATAYGTVHTAFETAKGISDTPSTRTPVTIADTQTTMAACRAKAQELVQKAQASGLIGSVEAAELDITFRKTTKTPIATPTAVPDLSVQSNDPLAVKLRVRELGAELSALPPNCVGYQVRRAINLTSPPMSPDQLTLIGTGTRRFFDDTFEAGDVGKQVYYAVRYVTAKQLFGPWSNIVATTIVSG